jgi:hypothetical protein
MYAVVAENDVAILHLRTYAHFFPMALKSGLSQGLFFEVSLFL